MHETIIKFNEDNQAFVELKSLENLKKGLEYIDEKGLDQELIVVLDQGNLDELLISDNIEFFEELAEKDININFRYDTGKKTFSLQNVLDKEHFLRQAVEDIKSKNFSPLEQLIAIYDIAKVFKSYKSEEGSIAESRALYEYLESDYMVCVGYADLVSNLAHRLHLNVTEISLDVTKSNGQVEGHARNYVNLVDPKYGIDGFYVLEPTWEQGGTIIGANRRKSYEQSRSTYKDFLLTTDAGRHNYTGGEIDVEHYDSVFTATSQDELNIAIAQMGYRNNLYELMQDLDPEFSQVLNGLDTHNPEDAQIILDYFNSKVNRPISKKALLDAIINVKRTIYVNFTDQDFEDMRMGYSITEPFAEDIYDSYGLWIGFKPLYGEEQFDEYMERRYNDIKSESIEEASKRNPCLNVKQVLRHREEKEIQRQNSQTQKLGQETLEEQKDTQGKNDVQADINSQLAEKHRTQEDIIQ